MLKKLLTILIASQILLGTVGFVAFAKDPVADPPAGTGTGNTDAAESLNKLKNLQFDVTKTLKLTTPCDTDKDCPGSVTCTKTTEAAPGICNVQSQSYFGGDTSQGDKTYFPIFRFLIDIIDTLVKTAGTIAVIMLIVTGFVMIFSMGNQNTLEKAKQMFLYEILGLLAIFLSYIVITLVQSIFTQ
jgi:hypothetical protein